MTPDSIALARACYRDPAAGLRAVRDVLGDEAPPELVEVLVVWLVDAAINRALARLECGR